MDPLFQNIFDSVVDGNQEAAQKHVQAALDAGVDPTRILNDGMIAGMAEVGRLFEEGEFFVPEMLIAARAMQGGLSILKPHLVAADFKPIGKIVAGSIQGDMHDIGKNLVCMMLEGAAFEIVDLGVDVKAERFVEAVKSSGANMVAMSAMLTTTMSNMKSVIQALEDAGLRGQVKVMVGGAPLTEAYAREIGADGYAPDASRAVVLARSLAA